MAKDNDITDAIEQQTEALKTSLNVDAVTSELKKLNDVWKEGDSEVTEEIQASSVMNVNAMGEFARRNEAALKKAQKEAEKNSPINKLTESLKAQNEGLQVSLSKGDLGAKLKKLNKDSNENSLELASQFADVSSILENPSSSDEEKQSASETLAALGKLAQGEKQRRESEKKLKSFENKSLENLTKTLEAQNEGLQVSLSKGDLGAKLKKLNKDSNENSLELASQFADVSSILENPSSSDEEKKSASETLEALGKLAQGEEQRRESEKKLKSQASIWNKIKENTKGMSDGLKSLGESLKSKGGLLAGLAGIALLLFDPETFIKIINGAIDFVVDMFKAINKIVEGDIGGALELIWNNAGILSGIILGIGLKFGGKIISGFKALKVAVTAVRTFMQMKWLPERIADFKGFLKGLTKFAGKGWNLLKNAMSAAKAFMMTSFIPGMMGMFSSIGAALAPILAAIAPMLVPALLIVGAALAIGLAIKSLYNAFNDAFKTFEETGSIMETFKAFISGLGATMIGYPMDLLKDAISWVASAFGFDDVSKSLDSFSFQDIIKNGIGNAFDWFGNIFASIGTSISNFFSPIIESFSNIFQNIGTLISELPAKIYGFIPDLIKDLVSWVASALGFEKFSELLDSFSFTDIFQNVVDTILDTISGLMDSVVSFITSVFDFDFIGALTKAIPGFGKLASFLGFGSTETKKTEKKKEEKKTEPLSKEEKLSNDRANRFRGEGKRNSNDRRKERKRVRDDQTKQLKDAGVKDGKFLAGQLVIEGKELTKNQKIAKARNDARDKAEAEKVALLTPEEKKRYDYSQENPFDSGAEFTMPKDMDSRVKAKNAAELAKTEKWGNKHYRKENAKKEPLDSTVTDKSTEKSASLVKESPEKESGGILSSIGNFFSSSSSDEPVVEKLETPDSGVYTRTNENINEKAEADKESNNIVVAPGGWTSNSNATTNVTNSSTVVSSGITPDDMVKLSFMNTGY